MPVKTERIPKSNSTYGAKNRHGDALAEVERVRHMVMRELDIARRIRAEAERYRLETETKARSQAQLIVLQARLSTQKEIAELKRKTTAEIQKVLADIRMVRITAQEELEMQRKFTNAARIKSLSIKPCQQADTKPVDSLV